MCCIFNRLFSDLIASIGAIFVIVRGVICASGSDSVYEQDTFNNQHFLLVQQTNKPINLINTRKSSQFSDTKKHRNIYYNNLKTNYKYKMMSKKGLLKFVKYTLIFSNAFGFILSIFLGLFGIAYPDKHFPLSYKGREMALCSLFCMLFTTVGYCGAQNHRRILLIVYGATNVIIVIIVVILWFLFRENSILGNKEISNMFITTLAITIAVMFLFSFILAFHIQTFKNDSHDSIVSQSHQLLQQTTAFLQQQHQQQIQHQQQQQQQQQHHHHHHQNVSLNSAPNSGGGLFVGGQQTLSAPSSSLHHLHHQQQAQPQQHSIAIGNGASHEASLILQQRQHALPNNLGHQFQLLPPPPPPPPPTTGNPQQIQSFKQVRSKQNQQLLVNQSPAVAMQLPPPQLHSQMLLSPPQVPSPNSQQPQTQQALVSSQTPATSGQQGGPQLTLMRNQSSPLPGAGGGPVASYQSTSSQVPGGRSGNKTSSQPQTFHQSQKQSSQAILQSDQPVSSIHHHHSSVREHHSRIANPNSANSGNRMPSCPVQYCTFQCDRTV